MKNMDIKFFLTLIIIFTFAINVTAHCEIPCGIYDDAMRIKMIGEHITTIEKSMNQIKKIESDKSYGFNQLIRWVMNKEEHANKLQNIVTQYFMTQRIKPDTENYGKKLEMLHQLLIYSMKCKQTTDLNTVKKLRTILKNFDKLYFGKK